MRTARARSRNIPARLKPVRAISKTAALLLAALILITLAWSAPASAAEALDPGLMRRARALHERAIVVDTHVDTPLLMSGRDFFIGRRNDRGHLDLVRMKEGGVDAVFMAVFVSNEFDDRSPAQRALQTIALIHQQVGLSSALAEMAYSSADIRRIHATGRRAVLIGMENGGPVEGSLEKLRIFQRLGVRYITLTHNKSNPICDSSTDEPRWGGLSPFGIELVAEMNRLGMMIDVSHISDDAFFDVIEHSRAPVIASHSGARALCSSPRNLSDEMLAALAAGGGVVHIIFYSGFLSDGYAEQEAAARERLRPQFERLREEAEGDRGLFYARAMSLWGEHAPEPPGIDVLIDHIEHAVRVAGIDHVGLGSDYDGAGSFPPGLEDVSGYPLITYHLLGRGYAEEDVLKILGGNLLRVFEEIERRAGG